MNIAGPPVVSDTGSIRDLSAAGSTAFVGANYMVEHTACVEENFVGESIASAEVSSRKESIASAVETLVVVSIALMNTSLVAGAMMFAVENSETDNVSVGR